MNNYLNIPLSKLCRIKYANSNRIPDDLEWSFIKTISDYTGFFLARIHLKEAKKSKYSRKFDYFDFEYEGENYILEKGIIKKGSN